MGTRRQNNDAADEEEEAMIILHNPLNLNGRRTITLSQNDLRRISDSVSDKNISSRIRSVIRDRK